MTEKPIILDEYESTLREEGRIVSAKHALMHVVAVISTEVTQTPEMIKEGKTSNKGAD